MHVPHNPWLDALRDFGVIAAADLAAIGAHEAISKKYTNLPTFQPMAKEAHLAVTKSLRGLAARDAAYTRGISNMPSGKGSRVITKTAGVAEDQARVSQFQHDSRHNKLRWATPEASQAIQSAATAGAAYAATKGLAHMIPSAGAAAPWLAGAAGLYSATDYGKKVSAHENRINKTMAAIIRNEALAKQANIVEELAEEGFNHAVNHKLFHSGHQKHPNKYIEKVAEWNDRGAFMGTALGGLSPHEKKAFFGAAIRSLGQAKNVASHLAKPKIDVAKNAFKNATKIEKGIAGGVAGTVAIGSFAAGRTSKGDNSNQIKQANVVDGAIHAGHGILNHLGNTMGHLSGGHVKKYVATNARKTTQAELDALHKMDDDSMLKEFLPDSKEHAALVDLIQRRKGARALAGGAAAYGVYNKVTGAPNGTAY